MTHGRLIFRIHALRRMFQRGISAADVHQALASGEEIESYPDDTPFSSRLVLGWSASRPLHVVAAEDREAGETIVITVYEPDLNQWEPGFRRRKIP
jgi:hypothetical protein